MPCSCSSSHLFLRVRGVSSKFDLPAASLTPHRPNAEPPELSDVGRFTEAMKFDPVQGGLEAGSKYFFENSKNAPDPRGILTCRRGRRRGHRRVSLAFLVCPNESLAPSHRVSLGLALIFVASARVRLEFDFGLEFCLCSTLLIAVFAQVPWKLSIRSCL